ncbi:MAG: hypothetical protein ACUVRC_08410 [Desulfotomaculales bacterium]
MVGGVDRINLDVRAGTRMPWYLRPGQVVLVEVVERFVRGGVVNLGGHFFPARGGLPADAGARFWCIVEGAAPEVINLRRLEPARPGPPGAADVLAALDLPPEEEVEKVVREFMRRRLPLDRREILETVAALRRLPIGERDAFRQVRVWLKTLNLPEGAARAAEAYLLGRAGAEGADEGSLADAAARGQSLLNRAAAAAPEAQMAAFALLARQAAGDVYVLWREDGEARQGALWFVVHLDTEGCGSIWVALAVRGVELGVEVFCDPARADFVGKGLPVLQEELAAGGYRVSGCRVIPRRVSSVAELLGEPAAGAYAGLDATV